MKKCIAVLLAALLVLSLAACGDKDTQFSEIETQLPDDPDAVGVDASQTDPGDDGSDFGLTPVGPADIKPLESVTITMPDVDLKPVEWGGVTLEIPQVDYEITADRFGSAYNDNYTVPNLQIDVPDFGSEDLEGVFVSIADNLTLENQDKLAELSDAEFAEIASIHLSLTDKLLEAYKLAGINVAIDPMSGAIPIDASLLYNTDEFELRPEGKQALKEVFTVYYSVISQPEFRDAVDTIVIEGHTDTAGSYEYNQTLSEKRAQAVYDFLLSDECGLPDRDFLAGILTTVGRSYDEPVYAADGTVDMAASRRVEIRFALDLG